MIKTKDIKEKLKDIQEFLLEEYKQKNGEKERDWRTYEQQLAGRIGKAIRNLEPLIDEATKNIQVHRGKGRKSTLSLKQKVILLLSKELIHKSNRSMSSMLSLFSLLSGIDVNYKTVERLYSDPEVEMAIHNLHILILRKKGVKEITGSGDGTGYSLTIRKHYASEVEKRKEKAKEAKKSDKKLFVYSFKLLDLDTKLYVAYGMSLRSEKQAFEKAKEMLENVKAEIDINLDSIRLDRYYSFPSYIDKFGETKVYIIPRKNSTLRGSWKWKRTMKEFVTDTRNYLKEYYRREISESEFSVDKRWFGWKIEQRKEDRIETALACVNLWHNLFRLY
jgi:transposase